MQCARDMGLEEGVISFVLPLATTVNMNGTALYEAVTVIFISQVGRTTSPHLEISKQYMHSLCAALPQTATMSSTHQLCAGLPSAVSLQLTAP